MSWTRNRAGLMLAFVALVAVVSSAPLLAAGDEEPPMILGFELSPSSVNTGIGQQEITVRAHLLDFGSGVSGAGDMRVQFKSPSGQTLVWATFYHDVPGMPDTLVDGSVYSGLWEVSLVLPQGSETGTWELEDLFVIDQAGNYRILVASDMAAEGHVTTFEVKNSSSTLYMPMVWRMQHQAMPTPSPEPTLPTNRTPVPPN